MSGTALATGGVGDAGKSSPLIQLPVPEMMTHPHPTWDPHTLLIRFRDGATGAATRDALSSVGAVDAGAVGDGGWRLVRLSSVGPSKALRTLRGDTSVDRVSFNYLRHAAATPNDTYYSGYQASYLGGINMPKAWDTTKGSTSNTVAVLDTGVDLDHPDLAARIKPGYDFVNNDPTAQDDNGHGTMVAGIAAAITNNSKGVAGVAWNASIIPVKVLDATGVGTDDEVIAGIDWAADDGANIINLSLAGYGDDPALDDAVAYAISKNATVVASVADDGTSDPSYPAASPGALAVSGTDDSAGNFAWFSNYGWYVGVSAPSFNVTSTYLASGATESYATGTGTSFAAAMVSGIALLVKVLNPTFSPSDIVSRLEKTAKDQGPQGIDPFYGWGRVDGSAAVTNVKATAGTVPAGDSHEPNPTLDTATTLVAGTSTTGTIAPEGDVDWFKTTVSSSGSLSVTVTPPTYDPNKLRAKEMNPIVDVYGPDLKLLAENDVALVGEPETASVPAVAGTYVIEVRNVFGSQTPSSYTVNATTSSDPAVPTFDPYEDYIVGESPGVATAIADVTGDGLGDVLMTTGNYLSQSDSMKLFVYPQMPDHSLDSPLSYDIDAGGSPSMMLGVGDLNNDGLTDAAVAVGGGVDVYYQSGGVLGSRTLVTTSTTPTQVVVADMNRDRRADLVVTTSTGVYEALQKRTGFVFRRTNVAFAYAAGDVSGDGVVDLVSWNGQDQVAVYTQLSGTSFAESDYGVSSAVTSVAIGDVNGDSRLDVIAALFDGTISVLTQDAGGHLNQPVVYASQHNPEGVVVADINGDGLGDVVVSHDGYPEVGVYLQTSDGALSTELYYTVPMTVSIPPGLSVGDASGDGGLDVALASSDLGVQALQLAFLRQHTVPHDPAWTRAATPNDFATGVARSVSPTVTFGRDLDPSSITGSTVWLMNASAGNIVDVALSYDAATRTITIDPTPPTISKNTPYVVFVSGVMDTDGNVMPGVYTFRFTTGST